MAGDPPQDALTYVRAVKARFQASNPQTYEAFLEVMRDFKNSRSDTPDVVRRVEALLRGHPDLLDGFNCFLPEPFKFSAVKDAAEKANKEGQPTIGGGYNLLKRIRKVYSHDERPYHAFLAILIRFRNEEFTTDQVIKNVSTLFYDEPELLHGKDGLEFFVPKNCPPPKLSPWFQWSPATHHRFGRTTFRVAVRMLLLCEKRSRGQPPDLTKKKVRLDSASTNESSEGSSSEEDSSDDEDDGPKDQGRVDPDKMPPIWDQLSARVFSEFEKLALCMEPMTDDQCWEDSFAQKEENDRNADATARGKRSKPEVDTSPPDSPPPPGGAPRSRKSARIIAKVNRGGTHMSYKHLNGGRGRGTGIRGSEGGEGRLKGKPGRMSLTKGLTKGVAGMSTLSPDLPPMEGVELKLVRNPKEMSLLHRAGLHQLPPNCMERILFFLAEAEGKDELKAQREALIKSLGKHKKQPR